MMGKILDVLELAVVAVGAITYEIVFTVSPAIAGLTRKLLCPVVCKIIKREKHIWRDRPDVWSFAHTLATLLLSILIGHIAGVLVGAVLAFILMFAYEVFIDGVTISDPNGFSWLDIVFNMYGAITYMALGLLRLV